MLVLHVPPLCSPALCTTNDARHWRPERSIACVPGMSTSPGARAWSTSTAADNAISVLVSIFPTMRFNAALPPATGIAQRSGTYRCPAARPIRTTCICTSYIWLRLRAKVAKLRCFMHRFEHPLPTGEERTLTTPGATERASDAFARCVQATTLSRATDRRRIGHVDRCNGRLANVLGAALQSSNADPMRERSKVWGRQRRGAASPSRPWIIRRQRQRRRRLWSLNWS
jgi:hypothetical protein